MLLRRVARILPDVDVWNPDRYERFAAERDQPFWDLVAMLTPVAAPRVADLGCGTGRLTAALHARLGASETVGIDSSAAMLERAAGVAGPRLRFEHAHIAELPATARFDVVISNAALHWLPDHERLLDRLRRMLLPGGQLAIQMPDSTGALTHTTAAELAGDQPFAAHLAGHLLRAPLLAMEEYAVLLHRLGFAEQRVERRIYAHLLDSRADVVEWFRGSLLTDYERRLPPPLFERFLTAYRERVLRRLDDRRPYLLPFPRLFLWARLP